MLTSTGRALAGGGAAFALGGLLLGNWPFFTAGAMLLLLASFGSLARTPRVERTVDATVIERGGRFAFELVVDVPRGLGAVEVGQRLPEEFELVEGNNFHVLTLGLRPRAERLRFAAKAPKRGEYVLPPVSVKVVHALGFSTTPTLDEGASLALRVEPRP